MTLSPKKVALLLAGWLMTTDVLIWIAQHNDAWPIKVLAGVSMSLLPGVALLRALRVSLDSFLEGLLYSLGLSVLLLMVSGLAANQILYILGDQRPLELPGMLGAWNLVTLACIAAGVILNRQTVRMRSALWLGPSKTTCALVLSALLLPIIAAGGAFRLNNGGDALVAEGALCWAAGVIACALVCRSRLSDSTLAWCIFTVGLSILLMTALRGWDITGHDIMREFRVYTLAHVNGRWNIAAYRDPYNACLSITILPEMYAKLLHISGLVVFKLILQTLFAVCPVVIFVMLRQHVSKLGALVGCGLFISYPTFINDSAMLTRQGVAYLFFSLALLAAMRTRPGKIYRSLFFLCGLGVVLSHYSTSYMFVAIFAVALGCKLLIRRLRGWRLRLRDEKATVLSPAVLATLTLATFLWYGLFTATTGGLLTTLRSSVANIPHLLSDDNKSADTSASLLLATHKSQIDIYQSYLAQSVHGTKLAQAAEYRPEITSDDIPVTALGKHLGMLGTGPSITAALRQNFAKVLQLLAALSVIYATYLSVFYATYLFARKKPFTLPLDLICLSMAGIILLAGMVALPTLSLNYGVLRTFQQSLIFLVVPLTLLLTFLGRLLRPPLRVAVATGGTTLLFFLFTGLFAQLFGGVGAALTLNNHGLYYGLYYTTRADLQAYSWMKVHIPAKSDVRAANYAKAVMHDPYYPFAGVGILPAQRPIGSYAYLDQAQLVAHKFYVYHEGSPLITTFPIDYYNDWTNQIYSTATTGVYR